MIWSKGSTEGSINVSINVSTEGSIFLKLKIVVIVIPTMENECSLTIFKTFYRYFCRHFHHNDGCDICKLITVILTDIGYLDTDFLEEFDKLNTVLRILHNQVGLINCCEACRPLIDIWNSINQDDWDVFELHDIVQGLIE